MADADAKREEHWRNHLFLPAFGAFIDERFAPPVSLQFVGDWRKQMPSSSSSTMACARNRCRGLLRSCPESNEETSCDHAHR
jgi:hypothetical protein